MALTEGALPQTIVSEEGRYDGELAGSQNQLGRAWLLTVQYLLALVDRGLLVDRLGSLGPQGASGAKVWPVTLGPGWDRSRPGHKVCRGIQRWDVCQDRPFEFRVTLECLAINFHRA